MGQHSSGYSLSHMLSWEGFWPVQVRLKSRVTNCSSLPETVLVLALKAPHPESTFGPRQTGKAGHPIANRPMQTTLKTGRGAVEGVAGSSCLLFSQ